MSGFVEKVKQAVCEHEWEEVKEGVAWEDITYRVCKKCGKKEEMGRQPYQEP